MKRLNQITGWAYQRIKWTFTPLFFWVIVSRSLGWLEFDWWNGAFVLGYVFLYREIEKNEANST